ncbi:Dolichyl-phosphate-mannose-protein mannosyltransferase [Gimesia alba]|uniref:Dolichyl-phosphate-mannose-protein mannosyltransferase n=2 Tax=Gimesia alba TaxID=2527973 RepID=A0A517R8Q1_9PLAN|nr:Dolichyl-phosphate-mannose-protein mannosyltransferase [Gimesia alba]
MTGMTQLKPPSESENKQRPAAAFWYLLLACLAFVLVAAQLDCAQDLSLTGPGPGMTVDEPFNVGQGVFLVRAIRVYGLGVIAPESLREIFEHPNYLPDHPPLGRLLIGIAHETVAGVAGSDERPFVVTYGRYASAFCFACLVFVVGWFTFRRSGHTAALIAVASLVAMPRLFGHAHLAALETVTALFYVSTVLAVVYFWDTESPPTPKRACLTGLVLGLALLTKIQAVLIPIPVMIWALWKWRQKAILPLICWGGIGVLIFFVGWPWLWFDPVGHLSEYLGRTTGRAALYVEYFGSKYADRDLPWHYPWVMLLTTIPVGLLVLGSVGSTNIVRALKGSHRRPSGEILLLLSLLWPLFLFSLPGITVYDGVRLFLMVFPLVAILIGQGGALAFDWLRQRIPSKPATSVAVLLLLSQAYATLAFAPYWLSSYSLLIGGLQGANAAGMELTYWGDSITADMLQRVVQDVPENSVIQLAPLLHPAYLQMLQETPELKQKGIRLIPFESEKPVSEYVLYFQRNPYLPDTLKPQQMKVGQVIREVNHQGVALARLIRLNEVR